MRSRGSNGQSRGRRYFTYFAGVCVILFFVFVFTLHPGDDGPTAPPVTKNVDPATARPSSNKQQERRTVSTEDQRWSLDVTKKSKSYEVHQNPKCFNPNCADRNGGNKWALTACSNKIATAWNKQGVASVNRYFENYGDDLGNYKEGALWDAYWQFHNATKLDKTCVNAFTNLALVATKLERYDTALATLAKVAEKVDEYPIILVYKGITQEAKGDKQGSLTTWAEAIKKKPSLWEEFFALIMKKQGSPRMREYDHEVEKEATFNLFFFKQFYPVAYHNYAQLPPGTPDYFVDNKFIILRKIVHPYPLRTLQKCYHTLVKSDRLKLGDPQAKRYVAYNSRCIAHFHWTFTDLVRRVVAHEAKATYTYFGGYVEGSFLQPHTDRFQCEFTFSMSIENKPWNDPWLLSLGHKPKFHKKDDWPGRNPEKKPPEEEIVDADLFAGDALLFMGRHLIHFRRGKLKKGEWTNQAFMHFVQKDFSKALG